MLEQHPLPYGVAARGVGRCTLTTVRLLRARRVHLPRSHVNATLQFADGSSGRVYRETVVDDASRANPCVLVVEFRLRFFRGALMHWLFRLESILNTPMFVGFPGFVSKLWCAHDENGVYRGVYEWDGPERAEYYARCLWRILALVSVRGSIGYAIVPGLDRDSVLADPARLTAPSADVPDWARLVAAN